MVAVDAPPMPTVDAIWAALEAQNATKPQYEGYGISASKLGKECDRELWYDLRWASEQETFNGRKLRIFERGNIEEDRVVADLKLAGLDVREVGPDGKQFRFSMARGFLRGKADGRVTGVIEAPKAEHVIEIKSARAADWRGVLKHGLRKHKPDHWHQLHAGMAGLGCARDLYIMVNKDTEEILTERLHLDEAEMLRQTARVERIVDTDIAPERAFDKPTNRGCMFCKHKAACHDGGAARRHCRTCIHFTFTSDGNGHCDRFDAPKRPDSQQRGANCPAHLFLPSLVAGMQIDCDPVAETITYELADGSKWIDGRHEPETDPDDAALEATHAGSPDSIY